MKKNKDRSWSVYILQCKGRTLYTGITNNLERRLKLHKEGKASRYTRSHRPIKLVYTEVNYCRSEALIRECAIKAMPKQKKKMLFNKKSKQRSKKKLRNKKAR